jgi:fructose-specific phosphotransferase system component IIB
VAKKHSKAAKGEDASFTPKTPTEASEGADGQDKPGGHSEQSHLDSIIFDLLGDKAVDGVTTYGGAQSDAQKGAQGGAQGGTQDSATGNQATGPAVAQDAVTGAATAADSAAKGVTRPVPDFDTELEAVIAAAFEGLPVRSQPRDEELEPAKESVDPAAAVLEATILSAGAAATATFPEKGDSSSEQGTQASTGFSADFIEPDEFAPTPPFIREPIRRRHIWPVFICAIIVFIILTGGLTYVNRLIMADQAEMRTAIQREGSGYLDESIALIQEADIVVIALDKAIESQVREEDVPQLEALLEQVDDTQKSLDEAIAVAKKAQETFLEEDRRELARHAQEAAEYRKQMLELSSQLTEFDIAAMKSALSLEYAWSLIVDADADMRSAVEVVNGWGANAVEESRDYNQQALDKLTLAEEMLATTKATFPTVDIQLLSDYLSAKKASAELALASDNAFLEGDYDTANIRNEEFIAQDAEAVRLAATIPSDPLSVIVTAYEKAVGQLRDDYKVVRSNAADADAYLRAYLGVDVQQSS